VSLSLCFFISLSNSIEITFSMGERSNLDGRIIEAISQRGSPRGTPNRLPWPPPPPPPPSRSSSIALLPPLSPLQSRFLWSKRKRGRERNSSCQSTITITIVVVVVLYSHVQRRGSAKRLLNFLFLPLKVGLAVRFTGREKRGERRKDLSTASFSWLLRQPLVAVVVI